MTGLLRVPVPAGTAHAQLFPSLDPDSGTVVFTGRPARSAWAVGQDLLAGWASATTSPAPAATTTTTCP
jgi:hypothetical protein